MSRILRSGPLLDWAIQSTDNAVDVYDEFKAMVTTLTKSYIGEAVGVRINGSFDDQFPFLLAGLGNVDFLPRVVKILRRSDDFRLSHKQRQEQLDMEVRVSEILQDITGIALVPTTAAVVSLPSDVARHGTTNQEGLVTVIIMPRYIGTLHTIPTGSLDYLAIQGARLVAAVRALHSRGLVHMDIKSTNVFFDSHGSCYLGDFGSCKFIYDPSFPDRPNTFVTSCTTLFCFCNPIGMPAQPKYDWFMLLSMLMVQGLADRQLYSQLLLLPGSNHFDLELTRNLARTYVETNDAFGKLISEVLTEFELHCKDSVSV